MAVQASVWQNALSSIDFLLIVHSSNRNRSCSCSSSSRKKAKPRLFRPQYENCKWHIYSRCIWRVRVERSVVRGLGVKLLQSGSQPVRQSTIWVEVLRQGHVCGEMNCTRGRLQFGPTLMQHFSCLCRCCCCLCCFLVHFVCKRLEVNKTSAINCKLQRARVWVRVRESVWGLHDKLDKQIS